MRGFNDFHISSLDSGPGFASPCQITEQQYTLNPLRSRLRQKKSCRSVPHRHRRCVPSTLSPRPLFYTLRAESFPRRKTQLLSSTQDPTPFPQPKTQPPFRILKFNPLSLTQHPKQVAVSGRRRLLADSVTVASPLDSNPFTSHPSPSTHTTPPLTH